MNTSHVIGADRAPRGTLAMLAGLAALGSLATNIILPAFADIGQTLSVSTRELAVTLSSFFIAFAFGQLLVGPASDRWGRRWLVLGGLAVLVAGSVVCARADRLEWLVAGRVIQGLGACATSVLARSIARDLFDGAALSRALAFIMVAMAAAPGFSPLLGGLLSQAAGWRGTFWLVALIAALLASLYLMRMGETHPFGARRRATLGETLVNYVRLLVDRRFASPALGVSMAVGGLFAFFASAPAILMDGMGLTPIELGYFFAATVFVVFGAGIAAPRLAARWSTQVAALAGSGIALAGGAALLGGPAGLVPFSLSMIVFLFGIGLINPLGTAMTLQPFGAQAGAASALLGFLQMGAATIAISMAAALDGPAHLALGGVLVVCMGSSLVALLFSRER
ncbi:MAG: multidrug effflux MFS transporter [Burkholderiaceae bacterium]